MEYVEELIDSCWVDRKWAASINIKGCFFCEIAVAMDILFDGPGGLPITNGWWKEKQDRFSDQRRRYCYRCGATVPYPPVQLSQHNDQASSSNYNALKIMNSPKIKKNHVTLVEEIHTRESLEAYADGWAPWDHWGIKGKINKDNLLHNKFSRNALSIKKFCRQKFIATAKKAFSQFRYNPVS